MRRHCYSQSLYPGLEILAHDLLSRHQCFTIPERKRDSLGKLLTCYGPKMHILIREAVEPYVNPLNPDIVASKASGFFSVHISTSLPTSTTPLPPLSFIRSRLSAIENHLILSRSASSYGTEAQIYPSRSSSVGCVFSNNMYYVLIRTGNRRPEFEILGLCLQDG
jgi:hypothetical protein